MDCVLYSKNGESGKVTLTAEQMLSYLRQFNDMHTIGVSGSHFACPLFEILNGNDVQVVDVSHMTTTVKPHPGPDEPFVRLSNSKDCVRFSQEVDSRIPYGMPVTVRYARDILNEIVAERKGKK
jgi:hypothetical protein